jgi:hypothetical protein
MTVWAGKARATTESAVAAAAETVAAASKFLVARIASEGKRSWWIGRASNPVGGAMRRWVGSTPIPLRHRTSIRLLRGLGGGLNAL